MMPTSFACASQTGNAPMFSALSRVQIDTIDSSGMQVESVCRFDFSTSETLMDVVPSYFSSEICRQTSSETRPAQILPTQFLAFCSEASSRCRRWTGDGGLSWGGGYRTRVQSYLCASSVEGLRRQMQSLREIGKQVEA